MASPVDAAVPGLTAGTVAEKGDELQGDRGGLAFLRCLPSLCKHRHLIWQLTRREISGRYRGSQFGVAWAFVTPLLQLGLYALVFGVIFQARWTGRTGNDLAAYALVLFCGLSVFSIFSEAVGRAPRMILDHPNYVKKVVFPLELLNLVSVSAAVFHGACSLLLCMAMSLALGGQPSIHWLFLPVLLVPYAILVLSACWLLASLGVYFRDIQQFMPPVVTAAFFLSPIFYSQDVVPAWILPWYRINPLSFFVESFRSIVLLDQMPDLWALAKWIVVGLVLLHLCHGLFMRLRKGFADVV